MLHRNRWMRDTIKRICFNSSVMYHIFEDNLLTNLQFMIKLPVTHPVT